MVREVGIITLDLISCIRSANEFPLHSEERQKEQAVAKELIKKLKDRIPVLRGCRCMGLAQEAALMKTLGNLEIGFNYWIESDKKR